jgi:hypothetical protein|tara:strand:+ start:456 stop:632 length:177 start_codon:yes stop_codon:yes gene_type:complete
VEVAKIKVGNLVLHPMMLSLGMGIVVKVTSEKLCYVSWQGRMPTIEAISQLENVSENR